MAGRGGVLGHGRIYETQARYGQRMWLCAEPGTRNQLKSFWVMAPLSWPSTPSTRAVQAAARDVVGK